MKANLRKAAITRKASSATQVNPGPQNISEIENELLIRLADDYKFKTTLFIMPPNEVVRLLSDIRDDIDILRDQEGTPNVAKKRILISYLMQLFFRIEDLSQIRINHYQSSHPDNHKSSLLTVA